MCKVEASGTVKVEARKLAKEDQSKFIEVVETKLIGLHEHSEKDKSFFETLLKLIEDNIENTELDVDFLCKHMYISRTKLYQKIKSITDQSVGDFVRTIRLKKAIHIMTHEDIPLNKVVERIGLQSSSNFSKVFKKKYGKSPLQFMQTLRQNQEQK